MAVMMGVCFEIGWVYRIGSCMVAGGLDGC